MRISQQSHLPCGRITIGSPTVKNLVKNTNVDCQKFLLYSTQKRAKQKLLVATARLYHSTSANVTLRLDVSSGHVELEWAVYIYSIHSLFIEREMHLNLTPTFSHSPRIFTPANTTAVYFNYGICTDNCKWHSTSQLSQNFGFFFVFQRFGEIVNVDFVLSNFV